MPIEAGTLYLATPGYHLSVELDRSLSLSLEERLHYSRPAIDYLFESAADAYGTGLLVAGAVAGGGLTVIANAPNPAGVALLRHGFEDQSIGAGGLLLGALLPTAVAAACFLLL